MKRIALAAAVLTFAACSSPNTETTDTAAPAAATTPTTGAMDTTSTMMMDSTMKMDSTMRPDSAATTPKAP